VEATSLASAVQSPKAASHMSASGRPLVVPVVKIIYKPLLRK
jgi:hypothetical protein